MCASGNCRFEDR
ncbi:MAG: hypothetical protein EA400_10305 [Chromatiaceae bacterium]|nr:MAG: hypothetical protein EA400_10305 [Chromatiaceae bacterium]